ncbi:Rieske 2Fe-2S domain-containing protein [Gordonia pseudamarae]|jgi:3-ketosteroid 9alpha-monooxygenase subunit A|uniref:Rieske-type oxygenase n=1 Tax=Gordonia pseudamarae TaxID=2831662 RepID=A0ABX6IMZ5_9ACTN|nr:MULTISPECIES: Rieske 2Fe-2S domain-containing protein [Gordonia]MBD0020748.1 Rieske 2Fe-2S domain-containing protein [Gordonia sp. (in: high G+C Gram-positive bacteria)]QHN27784.1 Rieske 2Fe-2S domain-containing protein [Gordonia pseudamarae]QHN36665.1 Rieske 2Fe-2S domain-containing protein [Gordonia pseudamarae]
MAPPPLSMEPTGWFQVAWSPEIGVGAVHTMKYFGREMVAWRSASGRISVFDAYCEHLGAHLGYGGHVVGENLACPFHGWEWNTEGRNVCVPYEEHPNKGRRIRSYPTVERNEAVWIWYDTKGREPYFDVPDIFADFPDDKTADDYYPPVPAATLYCPGLELHPQYVMENGVDFAHFKFVHGTPFMPEFTRHDFSGPISYVDFTIAFEEGATLEGAASGVESINAGLGCAVTRSWGMVDNRTMPAVTPVDDKTSDVRFTVWIGRKRGEENTPDITGFGKTMAGFVIEQFEADIHIWSHQRYSDPPALSRSEAQGFRAIRKWANQFYPTPDGPDELVTISRGELDDLRKAAGLAI